MHESELTRRGFMERSVLASLGAGLGSAAVAASSAGEVPVPLKIGHRAASMRRVGDFNVFKAARKIAGLDGVELQVTSGTPNLRDKEALLRYKREANRWGMMVPSVAGIWDRGVSILQPAAAGSLQKSIEAAEVLGASVVLAAFFKQKAPDMSAPSSFEPVVDMLRSVAPRAADAGITVGLENSLSPAENKKLVDLVDHPAVKVYYDPYNMAVYGYAEEAVPGFKLLGKERICQVHVKNGGHLLEEAGLVDWKAAFRALNELGYDGWYVFETRHADRAQVATDTRRNIAFIREHARMPLG